MHPHTATPGSFADRLARTLETIVFASRPLVLLAFTLGTVFFGYHASQLRMTAGFDKMLPFDHPMVQTFQKYRAEFGGGDRVTVAVMSDKGDIFSQRFFERLLKVHDKIFYLPGVYRPSVRSLFSPDVVFVDIIDGGFKGGRVVPADFQPTPDVLAQVRENILKANLRGRLVATDFSGALVTAELLPTDPETGKPVDYLRVARYLESLRAELEGDGISLHIIGFAKSSGEIADAATSVMGFFLVTLVLTALLLYWYSQSWWLTVVTTSCALIGVVWQLGLVHLIGIALDPMNILIPFLIFAVGISHAVQMMSGWNGEILFGEASGEVVEDLEHTGGVDPQTAARRTLRRLFVPATVALLTNAAGFLTIFLIKIRIVQELAILASMGLSIIILTKLVLLPVLLSYVRIRNFDAYHAKHARAVARRDRVWRRIAGATEPRPAAIILGITVVVAAFGFALDHRMRIGDVDHGVPELRRDAPYNRDVAVITSNFRIGTDVLSVYAKTSASGCVEPAVMGTIDSLVTYAGRLPGVLGIESLSEIGKNSWMQYNEGQLKWRALPRDSASLVLVTAYVERTTGLLNADCSVMPINIFLGDHRAETVSSVIGALQTWASQHAVKDVRFEFAGGNVGVVGATNEVVAAAELPMLLWVYGVIFATCVLTYRSVRVAACILVPLVLISVVVNAIMVLLGIGLKVNTLPVAAIGVGIAVDYGIYLCSTMLPFLRSGASLRESYYDALKLTGRAVVFIASTLAAGVAVWVFSELKFQADMGLLLTLTFLLNALGAVVLLPALLRLLRVDRAYGGRGTAAGDVVAAAGTTG